MARLTVFFELPQSCIETQFLEYIQEGCPVLQEARESLAFPNKGMIKKINCVCSEILHNCSMVCIEQLL